MTHDDFYNMLARPEAISPASADVLRTTVTEYPYFQAGWMLLLKTLNASGNIEFDRRLPAAAIHVANRRALYMLINARRKDAHPVDIEIIEAASNTVVDLDFLQWIVKLDSEKRTPMQSDTETQTATIIRNTETEQPQHPEPPQLAEQPHSDTTFGQETQQTKQEPKPTPQDNAPGHTTQRKEKQSLIDSFLQVSETQPQMLIKPRQDVKSHSDEVDRSERASEDIFTEALAKIYVKQGHYAKAIGIYTKLRTLHPEKIEFYDSQIEQLRQQSEA